MRTKNERPLRAAGRRRPGKQIVGVSERIRPTASDASVAAIAEGVQAGDMGEVVLYQAKGRIALDVRIERDTVWLTQTQMAKLFGRERSVVTKHVNNVFAEGVSWTEIAMCKICTLLLPINLSPFTAWIPSSRLAIELSPSRALSSEFGPHRPCGSIFCVGTR